MKFGEITDKIEIYEPFKYENQIRFDANESYNDINVEIKDIIAKNIDKINLNRYPDPYSLDLCKSFIKFYGLDIDIDNICAGNGSDELISIIMQNLIPKNSKILLLSPDFSMYKFYAQTSELETIYIEKNDLLDYNINDLIDNININKVDFVIISNPCNPTGQGKKRAEIIKLLDNCSCMICIDEAYMDFWDESILDLCGKYENLIVLKTCSKAMGLASLRVGFAISTKKVINMIKKVKSPYNVNTFSQSAAKILLDEKEWIIKNIENQKRMKIALFDDLNDIKCEKIKVFDTYTNFIVIKSLIAEEIYKYLLKNNIVIRYTGNLLRITASCESDNKKLVDNIEKWCKK